MELLFSGYQEEDALEQGYADTIEATTKWLMPQDFIDRCKMADGSQPNQRLIWLYRGPWSLLAVSANQPNGRCLEIPQQWLKWQRNILALRKSSSNTLLLVNRDTTTAHDLITSLGLKPNLSSRQDHPRHQELSVVFGKLIEWITPYYWDVFEALEAAAWIPEGIPFFRHLLSPPPTDILDQVTALMAAGYRQPETQAEVSNLKQENDILTQQLHQVEEKLKNLSIENRKSVAALKKTNEDLLTQIQKEQCEKIKQENDLLIQQLYQVQDELEKSMIKNNERIAALIKENEDLTMQTQQTQLASNQQKTQFLKQIQQEKEQFTKKNDELKQENELLIQQLHQVQDELERYHLANKQMQTTLAQSKQTMGKTRIIISNFICDQKN